MTKNTIIGTPANWDEEVLRSAVPVLVDFWAPQCMPCRVVAPLLDQIADETAGRAKVVKVLTNDYPELAAPYFVSSLPTLLVFVNGKVVEQYTGSGSKATLARLLEAHLAGHGATA
jgi:thioredoxin 1